MEVVQREDEVLKSKITEISLYPGHNGLEDKKKKNPFGLYI